jgi:hypothetical protein
MRNRAGKLLSGPLRLEAVEDEGDGTRNNLSLRDLGTR